MWFIRLADGCGTSGAQALVSGAGTRAMFILQADSAMMGPGLMGTAAEFESLVVHGKWNVHAGESDQGGVRISHAAGQ